MSIIAIILLLLSAATPLSDTAVSTESEIFAIRKLEYAAVAADLAGDVGFYADTLAEDWTGGMSNGEFQTKQMLISDPCGTPSITSRSMKPLQSPKFECTGPSPFRPTPKHMMLSFMASGERRRALRQIRTLNGRTGGSKSHLIARPLRRRSERRLSFARPI